MCQFTDYMISCINENVLLNSFVLIQDIPDDLIRPQ